MELEKSLKKKTVKPSKSYRSLRLRQYYCKVTRCKNEFLCWQILSMVCTTLRPNIFKMDFEPSIQRCHTLSKGIHRWQYSSDKIEVGTSQELMNCWTRVVITAQNARNTLTQKQAKSLIYPN